MELETTEALNSFAAWLSLSSKSIVDFLSMDRLNINEADLVRALVRWGNFQLQQHDLEGKTLRSIILPGLQKIRFGSLTQQEVVQFCQEELGEVLTVEEKLFVVVSVISGECKMMPTDTDVFCSPKLTKRLEPYTFISLPYADAGPNYEIPLTASAKYMCLSFKVTSEATIVGLKFNVAGLGPYTCFSLRDEMKAEIAKGSVQITSLHKGEVFFPFNMLQTLVPLKLYSVCFTISGFRFLKPRYTLPGNFCHQSLQADGLTLLLTDSTDLCVQVQGILFTKN